MKAKTSELPLLSAALLLLVLMSLHPAMSTGTSGANAILVKINSPIDYRTADTFEEAARDIENEKASILLIELNSNGGYLAPTIQIIQRLLSLNAKVIVYVGPKGAAASAASAYVAMASNVLVMNSGTSIGKAGIDNNDPTSLTYLMSLMSGLATAKARNPQAAERMVTDNLEYSAEEAYARGICDLLVDNYDSLLAGLKLGPQNVFEVQQSQGLDINHDTAYQVLKLFANISAIKYMFFGIAFLVMLNFVFAIVRPRKSRSDEVYERLLAFMRMEMQATELNLRGTSRVPLHETPLHTPVNIPSQPISKVNRLPTPLPNERLERPLEVKES